MMSWRQYNGLLREINADISYYNKDEKVRSYIVNAAVI